MIIYRTEPIIVLNTGNLVKPLIHQSELRTYRK